MERGGTRMKKFEYTPPEQPRELILKLGQKITDRIGHTVTAEDPEYYGLEALVTDEMAEVALKMKVRKPMTLAQVVKATGKEEKVLEELLQEMSNIGLLEYNWENPKHEKQYVLPMYVPGSAEFFNMKLDQIKEHPEVASFFERMAFLPLQKVTPMVPPGGAGIGMHVIPVEKAIETENESVSVEHISHWLDKYDGKYAAGPCSCRYSRGVLGEGCADDPEDWCIGVGDMADYLVETNKGHYITREKVMEILQRAEDNGFVHQITNIDGEDKIFAICNCNVNICNALRTSQLFNTPNMSRSAYVAKVETKDCVACGRCVEYCPAGAVKMGQKLCTKDGTITYPKHELPDNTKWGPEKWDMDYRDNNRINCYDTGTAPCKTACPAHIAVQGYLKMAAQGRYTDALALIKKENPFPAVCGRVCNHRCEDACTRGTVDQAVAIDDVKKFIAELDLNSDTRYIPPVVQPSNRGTFPQKIAIIGGGPAGLSCAFYLATRGYKPTVFEKNERPGGMLVYGIPSFKLEKNVVDAEIEVMRELGVDIKCGVEVGKDISLDELRAQGYQAFYIAIGCQGSRKAGIPGEDAAGVMSAVDFLHIVSGGNEDYRVDGRSVVIGGGNVAIDVARTAARCGSNEVSMFCLESEKEMPASKDEVEEVKEEGAAVHCGWGPKEILTENGKVRGIVLKKCVSVKDETGRFNPQFDENETMTVECEHVYLSIGQSILWGDLLAGSKVELGRGNGAVADPLTYQTAEPDIFVGGDVYTAARCGSNEVSMFCLESEKEMPASKDEVEEVKEEGAAVHCGWGPKEILTENGKVRGIVLKKCVSVKDETGRFNPQFDENETMTVECEHVYLSIGQSILWGDLLAGSKVELGRGNGAVADPLTYQTAEPDIFVGGDVYTGPSFAINAIAAGKEGAESIHRFVHENASMTIGRNRRQFIELDKENLALEEYDSAKRQRPAMDDKIDAHRSFRDAHRTLTEEQVKIETARCLGCGASVVDPNKCIGCGVCTTKCEFDAIHLHRELPECSRMVKAEDKMKAIFPYMLKREVKIRFGKKEK